LRAAPLEQAISRGLEFLLVVWVAVLVGLSLAGPASAGIPAATTSSLQVLWQVQATSVGLVLTLVVFRHHRGRLQKRSSAST
jgi:predicted cobalt transporter CbtA